MQLTLSEENDRKCNRRVGADFPKVASSQMGVHSKPSMRQQCISRPMTPAVEAEKPTKQPPKKIVDAKPKVKFAEEAASNPTLLGDRKALAVKQRELAEGKPANGSPVAPVPLTDCRGVKVSANITSAIHAAADAAGLKQSAQEHEVPPSKPESLENDKAGNHCKGDECSRNPSVGNASQKSDGAVSTSTAASSNSKELVVVRESELPGK